MNDLSILLGELDQWLTQKNLEIELVIIGAFALHLHGISTRMTMDIDTVKSITDEQVLHKIQEIGQHHGLSEWLNDQASTVVLPPGFFGRVLTIDKFQNIRLSVASRKDLIVLKVAAYYYRQESDPKDLDDLKLLKPSQPEIDEGIEFLKTFHKPDTKKHRKVFGKELEIYHNKMTEVLDE